METSKEHPGNHALIPRLELTAAMAFAIYAITSVPGCSARQVSHSQGAAEAHEPRPESVGVVLSNRLAHYGCVLPASKGPLAVTRTRWILETNSDGETVWLEGDFASPILKELSADLGPPIFERPSDSNGNLSFAYGRVRGIFINCGVDPRSGWGLKGPLTAFVISTNAPDSR